MLENLKMFGGYMHQPNYKLECTVFQISKHINLIGDTKRDTVFGRQATHYTTWC